MTVTIENNQDRPIFPFYEEEIGRVVRKVLDAERCPYEAEVNLTFVTPDVIREMNRNFRGIDKETDVLSFPMVPFDPPASYELLDQSGAEAEYFDPETQELSLGDIVINVLQAERQAAEYGHSMKREVCFLVAHSVLHLLGYDHMTEAEAQVMEEKQARYLNELGITRDETIPDGSVRSDTH